jgi:uncharacterized protein YbaR (Trm112 family)
MKRKKISISHVTILLIAVMVIFAGLFVYLRMQKKCDEVQCITLQLLDAQNKVEVSEKTNKSFLALYTLPSYLLRVEKRSDISKEDADTLTKVTVMRMQGQFETARSPYPGILSDAITCDKKFDIQPRTITKESQSQIFFTGYLNNRKQYGSCLDSEIQYVGLNSVVYCEKQKNWYRIEALIPTQSTADTTTVTNQLQNISCI